MHITRQKPLSGWRSLARCLPLFSNAGRWGDAVKLFGSFFGKQGVTAARSPDLSRRGLIIGGVATLIAAPAIVRAASLMPVKLFDDFDVNNLLVNASERYSFGYTDMRAWLIQGVDVFGKEISETIQWGELLSATQWKSVSSVSSVSVG